MAPESSTEPGQPARQGRLRAPAGSRDSQPGTEHPPGRAESSGSLVGGFLEAHGGTGSSVLVNFQVNYQVNFKAIGLAASLLFSESLLNVHYVKSSVMDTVKAAWSRDVFHYNGRTPATESMDSPAPSLWDSWRPQPCTAVVCGL